MTGSIVIRNAKMEDISLIQAIELAAGEAFRSIGMSEIADDDPPSEPILMFHIFTEHAWVATDSEDQPVAYLLLKVVDHQPHIEQVSVHPDYARQGIGKALINHVSMWARGHGFRHLTLTTFENVPWNAPYYARLGFRKIEAHELGRGMNMLLADEAESGLNGWPRIVMNRPLWGADSF